MLTLVKTKYLNVEFLKIQPQTHRGIPRPNRSPISQVVKVRKAVLGSHSELQWNYGKIEHENGLKF